jgi:hypothetical protein
MLIAGFTVIWTRQKATGTGAVSPGGPGGVKLFAAIEVAVIEITSGKTRLESLVQLSAAAGALKPATDAASAMVNPQDPDIFARFVIWSPSHSIRRPQGPDSSSARCEFAAVPRSLARDRAAVIVR